MRSWEYFHKKNSDNNKNASNHDWRRFYYTSIAFTTQLAYQAHASSGFANIYRE